MDVNKQKYNTDNTYVFDLTQRARYECSVGSLAIENSISVVEEIK